jgi:PAS domain S-box-containing protein
MVVTLQTTKRRATDRLKLIESASSLGTWELDVNSRTVQCSEQLLHLHGIQDVSERLTLDKWLSYVHPEDRELVMGEIIALRSDRESIDRQYRVVWPDGSIHWLHSKALPVFDDQGRQTRVVGLNFDMSEVKQLQSQLAQAQKLESVGQLAAGVAHEINTPIQYVGDNAKFLEDAFRELIKISNGRIAAHQSQTEARELDYLKAEVPTAIAQLIEGVNQVARIVRAMKEFSHPGPIEKAAVDINQAIESTVLVSKHEWKFVAEVTTDFDPDLPPVPCVVGELNQVILNLIVNAAHAIADVVPDSGEKGRIHISTRQRDSVVEISVADTGTGIPESIQSRVFDPFFTTKPVGKGTGQGLAIAHTVIVQKHKGTLRFESEPGRGTTFVIELPLVRELEAA